MGKSSPSYPIIRGKQLISCQANAEHWLCAAGYADRLTLDTFRQRLMLGASEVCDEVIVHLLSTMETDTHIPWRDLHLRNALHNLAAQQASSSLVTWLNSLTWDGTNRLDTFFIDYSGAKNDDYSRACARVMFLSAIARAYQPGCQADVMVVMIGKQGIGKSKSLMSLVPDETWFTDDLGGDLHDRRAAEGLQGKWLVEFGEFARINRATVEMVKSYISRRTDRYRPAYGRTAKDFPRQCIFIGTTNNHQPLQDLENRRFMPVHCPNPFISVSPDDRDQLWAEAVHRYRKQEPWWVLDGALLKAITEKQEDARHIDAWEELLRDKLRHQTQTSMLEAANLVSLKTDRLNRPETTRLGLALHALGFIRKRVRSGKDLCYAYERQP
jgi:predicted P-loop ATPase